MTPPNTHARRSRRTRRIRAIEIAMTIIGIAAPAIVTAYCVLGVCGVIDPILHALLPVCIIASLIYVAAWQLSRVD